MCTESYRHKADAQNIMYLGKLLKKSALALVLTMAVGTISPLSSVKAEESVTTAEAGEASSITIKNSGSSATAKPGRVATATVKITNSGTEAVTINDIIVTEDIFTQYGLTFAGIGGEITINAGAEQDVPLIFNVADSASAARASIGMQAVCSDGVVDFSIPVEIEAPEEIEDTDISVEFAGAVQNIYADAGEAVHVSVPVAQLEAYLTIHNLSVALPSGLSGTVSNVKLVRSGTTEALTDLYPYENNYMLEFDFVLDDDVKVGSYQGAVMNIKYSSYSGVVGSASEQVEIPLVIKVSSEKMPAQINVTEAIYNKDAVLPESTFELTVTLKNEGELAALNTFISVEYGDSGLIPNYTWSSKKLGNIAAGAQKTITIPVMVLEDAQKGHKSIGLVFTYKDDNGNEYTETRCIYIYVSAVEADPEESAQLIFDGENYKSDVMADAVTELVLDVTNNGKGDARNVRISVSDGIGAATGIIPAAGYEYVEIGELKAGETKQFTIPVNITKSAASGLTELTVTAEYQNMSGGLAGTASTKVYLMISNPDKMEETYTGNGLAFREIMQNPQQPIVGENVTVSFVIENTENAVMQNIRFKCENLSSAGFEPVSQNPYYEVGNLEPGESKEVTIKLKVGADISEGTNNLDLSYTYNMAGMPCEGTMMFYILDVSSTKSDGSSRPKVIVSDYSTSLDELKAGQEFDFTFGLENTHPSKAAKNIKVTVVQENDIFSVTEGSNSFYIDKIDAGEIYESSLNMKVKNDAMTAAYELKIIVEYEYDDMSQTDLQNGGVTENNIIKLQAVENAKPVVEGIGIYDWYTGILTVDTSATMTFEFYNMGKSTLDNVYFTLEGDYALETGSMYWLGSMSAGSYEYIEVSVLPLMEGMCGGKLIIHYEDSNGDEVTKEIEIEPQYVEAMPSFNDTGWENYEDYTDVFGEQPEAPKDLLPLWAFIAIQAGILVVVIPVTRGIRIALYKRKLRLEEEKES